MKQITQYFISGLLLIVPITITVFVINFVFAFTEKMVGQYLPFNFPGVSLAVLLCAIVAIGWLSSLWLLKSIIGYFEKLIGSIPVIKYIYNNIKQFSQAIFESKNLFKNAVLVPFPHAGSKSLGFVVDNLSLPLKSKFDEPHVCVFIPMSINLTAGFNIILPEREVTSIDITSESALQYVVTAGVVMPEASAGNEEKNEK